jgi:hypothetical protein
LSAFGQLGHQAAEFGVFGNVFVEQTVFGLADHTVVALGHDVVIVFQDQAGLALFFKQHPQIFAHTLDLDTVGSDLLLAIEFLQLVLGTCLRLDAHGLTAVACALDHFDGGVRFLFAGVDDDFVSFSHGVLSGYSVK